MKEFKRRDSLSILNKDERISYLETELSKLSKIEARQIPFEKVSKEAYINYDGLRTFSYADLIVTSLSKTDTIAEFNVAWADTIPQQTMQQNNQKLQKWLKFKLNLDTIIYNTKIEVIEKPKEKGKKKKG
jgi:hypothetical protein